MTVVSLPCANRLALFIGCLHLKSAPFSVSFYALILICKDFLKLVSEVKFTNEKKNFFVHYLSVKEESGWESRTFPSLFSKYLDSVADIIKSDLINEEDLSKVTVYLLCIFEEPEAESEPKIASAYHFSLADLKNYTTKTKYNDLTDKSWLNEELI